MDLLSLKQVNLEEVVPLTLVFSRFVIAALVQRLCVRATRISAPASWSHRAAFAGMGLLNNFMPAMLLAWSERAVTTAIATILVALTHSAGLALIRLVWAP